MFHGSTADVHWQNRAANRFLSVLTSVLYGVRLPDMEPCHKLLRRHGVADLELTADGFAAVSTLVR